MSHIYYNIIKLPKRNMLPPAVSTLEDKFGFHARIQKVLSEGVQL